MNGRLLTNVHFDEESDARWNFRFGADIELNVECPWRVMSEGGNTFGGCDHGHQFGLPAPVDGEERTINALDGRPVERAEVHAESADLTIWFEGNRRLEVFNNSCGYEGWNLHGPKGFLIVAQGGGTIVCWSSRQ
jgi:hypothetical protein